MKLLIKIFAGLITLAIIGGASYYAMNIQQWDFENVCIKGNKNYTNLCENVGMEAWSVPSVLEVNEKNYGTILGVAWRKHGSIISSRNQKEKRYSEKTAHYYIIGTPKESGGQFLRLTSETDVRPAGSDKKKK